MSWDWGKGKGLWEAGYEEAVGMFSASPTRKEGAWWVPCHVAWWDCLGLGFAQAGLAHMLCCLAGDIERKYEVD